MSLTDIFCTELNNSDSTRPAELDLVFVHGLSSNAISAWTTDYGALWPLWLKPMLRSTRLLLLNYPAPMLFCGPSSRVTLTERARNLADFLPTIGIGNRPTIFVCHSLGGVLIKSIIQCSIQSGSTLNIAANTVGIIFLATPHAGSELVRWIEWLGSALMKDLAPDAPYVSDLRKWFSDYARTKDIFISAYYEMQPYKSHLMW